MSQVTGSHQNENKNGADADRMEEEERKLESWVGRASDLELEKHLDGGLKFSACRSRNEKGAGCSIHECGPKAARLPEFSEDRNPDFKINTPGLKFIAHVH